MGESVIVKVTDIIGSPLCISTEDGQKVYKRVESLLKRDQQVQISFDHVELLISLFLNVAIGQLYGSFSEDKIRSQVRFEGLAEDDLDLLEHVVNNAKNYYENQQSYDAAWQAEQGEELQ